MNLNSEIMLQHINSNTDKYHLYAASRKYLRERPGAVGDAINELYSGRAEEYPNGISLSVIRARNDNRLIGKCEDVKKLNIDFRSHFLMVVEAGVG